MRFFQLQDYSYSRNYFDPQDNSIDFEARFNIKVSLDNLLGTQTLQQDKKGQTNFLELKQQKPQSRSEMLNKPSRPESTVKSSRIFRCTKCKSQFDSSGQRAKHSKWCQKDIRTSKQRAKYRSSYKKYKYECSKHDVMYYFITLDQLLLHLSTHPQEHRVKSQQRKNIKKQQPVQLTNIKFVPIEGLFRQFRSIKKLSKYQIQRLSSSKKVSQTTIRKYYRIFVQSSE